MHRDIVWPESRWRDIVLIDDDVGIREHWERRVARSEGRLRVRTFASRQQFQLNCRVISPSSLIFVDQHLRGDESGDVITRRLYEAGYQLLYLCTADPEPKLQRVPWIRGVVGKLPPEWLFEDDTTIPLTFTERQQLMARMDDDALSIYRQRMTEFLAVLYGQDSGAFAAPGFDGFSIPSGVMHAWERGITLSLTDAEIKSRVDRAWRLSFLG